MSSYDQAFYDTIREGCQQSAAVIVPLFLSYCDPRPKTVIDVGCGEGHWTARFRDHGAAVFGLDAGWVQPVALGPYEFIPVNLEEPLGPQVNGPVDLAVSLEVAEHLSPERGPGFVADLCALAPLVLFSAAIPGQGGAHHLHERWPDYWADQFATHGYAVSGALRFALWDDDRIEVWYRQNLLVAASPAGQATVADLFAEPRLAYPYRLVHPVLYDARRA